MCIKEAPWQGGESYYNNTHCCRPRSPPSPLHSRIRWSLSKPTSAIIKSRKRAATQRGGKYIVYNIRCNIATVADIWRHTAHTTYHKTTNLSSQTSSSWWPAPHGQEVCSCTCYLNKNFFVYIHVHLICLRIDIFAADTQPAHPCLSLSSTSVLSDIVMIGPCIFLLALHLHLMVKMSDY